MLLGLALLIVAIAVILFLLKLGFFVLIIGIPLAMVVGGFGMFGKKAQGP